MPAEPPSTGTIGNVLELPDAPGWEPLGHPISILLLICLGLGFPVQVLTNHPPAVTVAELFFFFFFFNLYYGNNQSCLVLSLSRSYGKDMILKSGRENMKVVPEGNNSTSLIGSRHCTYIRLILKGF